MQYHNLREFAIEARGLQTGQRSRRKVYLLMLYTAALKDDRVFDDQRVFVKHRPDKLRKKDDLQTRY